MTPMIENHGLLPVSWVLLGSDYGPLLGFVALYILGIP